MDEIKKNWHKNYDIGVSHNIDENFSFQALDEMVTSAALRFKDKAAFYNLGKQISFFEFDQNVTFLASYFQNELGLKKGDKIAIQLPNILQNPIAIFAALRAGLIVVNTNPLYTPNEMEFQFKDSGAKAIVILKNFCQNLESIIENTDIEHVICTSVGELLGFPKGKIVDLVVKYLKQAVPRYSLKGTSFKKALNIGKKYEFKKVDINENDIAFFQYTGGTTGISKAAMLTNKNILTNVKQVEKWFGNEPITEKDFVCSPLPLYHIFSLTCNCMTFLNLGCSNLLVANPKDMCFFTRELMKYPVTIITGVNTLFKALLRHKNFDKINWKGYRAIVAGGTSLQMSVFDEFEKRTGKRLIEGYGLTEASPLVSCNPVNSKGIRNKPGTIGLPLPGTEVCFFDDSGKMVSTGKIGELAVRGPQVMKGYWRRADETNKVLKDGWLFTGDMGFVDEDGYIKLVDRKKDMVIVSGFNVYPNEIEDVICYHPSVMECAVVGVNDERTGERPVAVVVKKADHELKDSELREHCKKTLSSYKIPKEFIFVKELPKTNVGKILRRVVKEEVNLKFVN